MAGNNAIQILRGTSANIVAANSSTTLLAGQPLYNTDKNYLTIGAADGDGLTKKPIAARKLVGYMGDTDDNVDGTSTLEMYSISGNSQGAMNITAQGIINMTGQACNIISSGGSLLLSAGTAGRIQANISNGVSISSSYNVNVSSNSGTSYITAANTNVNMFSTGNINAITGFFNVAATSGVNITSGAGQVRINAYSINMQTNALGSVNISTSMLNLNANNGFEIYSSSSVAGSRISSGSMSITGSSTMNINSPNLLLYGGYGGIGGLELRTTNPTGTVKVNMAGNVVSFPWKSGTVALTTDIPQSKYLHKLHVEHSYTYSNIYYTFDFNLDIVNNSATKINSAIGLRDALLEFVPEGDNSVHYPVFGMYTARYNGTATYQRDEICWLDSVNFYYYDDRFRFTVCGGINFNGHSTTNVIQDYEHQTQNSDLITSIGGSGSYITISDTVFSI